MNITVFGAGSIGSLFAGRMAYSGFDVAVVGRDPHVTEIRRKGLRIIESHQELLTHFPAETQFQPEVLTPDAILVTTKAYDNSVVAHSLAGRIIEETPILIMQNGMGNEEAFHQVFPKNPILRAITTEAAELIHPGIVKHVAFGKTSFGGIYGSEDGFGPKIQEIMNNSGLKTKKSKKIQVTMWQKLLTNSTICPLAALLHVPNGQILKKPSIQRIFDKIIEEGLVLANHYVPDEDFSMTREFILKVIEKTKDNRCSMLQDIERKRRTEIDYLNGFIVQESHQLGMKAPVNAAITDLIRHLERYPD
ncbi:MAG: 2-dehydropantoate 2-reductase [Candidatus Heimdallarchaeota archaeon]|nr:MAG: 2-dehydropantoate 2-reductase [Candidatus Heimdallarchaeota archaeon]